MQKHGCYTFQTWLYQLPYHNMIVFPFFTCTLASSLYLAKFFKLSLHQNEPFFVWFGIFPFLYCLSQIKWAHCISNLLKNLWRFFKSRALVQHAHILALFIIDRRKSVAKTKSGERGSPCLTLLLQWKVLPRTPFNSTEEVPEFKSSFI